MWLHFLCDCMNKSLTGAWIAHLMEFCLSQEIYWTRSWPTILTEEDFRRTNYKDHFSNWKIHFYLSYFSRYWLKTFSPFKGNNSYQESSDKIYAWRLVVPKIRIISAIERILANSFEDKCEKLQSDLCSIFNNGGHVFWRNLANPNGFGVICKFYCLSPMFYC